MSLPTSSRELEGGKRGPSQVTAFFNAEIDPRHGEMILFACCLSSGLVDSTTYNGVVSSLGEIHVFNPIVLTGYSLQDLRVDADGYVQDTPTVTSLSRVGLMRRFWDPGNTIFVGLGASGQEARAYGWVGSLTAIGCFVVGSFLFARLHRILGARGRGSLMMSFAIQAGLIILTAGLVQGQVVSSILTKGGNEGEGRALWNEEVPIVLLSLQSAGQIVASRTLGFNEIPTVVITSLLCDLMSDPKLFLLRNEKRDRRVIAFVLTLVGAIIGGWITKATQQIGPVLWLSAGIKVILAGVWGFWTTV